MASVCSSFSFTVFHFGSKIEHYDWYKNDEEYKEQVDSVQDVTLDFAESQLHKQINEGVTSATIFFLKTKGKKRGYIEKNEIEIIKDDLDLSGITDEDLRKYLNGNHE